MKSDQTSKAERRSEDTHVSRLTLLLDLLLFQLKLVLDGLRDLLLSPIAIVAVVIGLVTGGRDPGRQFRKVLRFGQRSEAWINLFGEHDAPGAADDLVRPLREKVMDEVQSNPWLSKAGSRLNRELDALNAAFEAHPGSDAREDSTQGDQDPLERAPDAGSRTQGPAGEPAEAPKKAP
jgi:hypothetical protein